MIRANGDKPLEIVFPEGCCKPIKYAAQLASAVGYVVRHLSLLKDIRTYDELPEERKEHLYGGLMGWFHFKDWETDPNVALYVDDMFQNSYRQWRNTMHTDYKMLKALGKDPLTSGPYDWIEQDEWKSMRDWFEDSKFKKISETNAKNRNMLPYPHTGGSKSNHVRAREMDQLKEERRRCIENGETTIDEVEVMGNILGNKAGRTKGLGYGVVPPKASRNSQSAVNSTLLQELRQYKEDLQNANDQLKSQEAKLQNYEEQIQTQDSQIQTLLQSQQGIEQMLQEFLAWKQKHGGSS